MLGAKVDHIKGASITAGAATCKITYPNIFMAIGGATTYSFTGGNVILKTPKFKYEGSTSVIDAPEMKVTGESRFSKAAAFLKAVSVEKQLTAKDVVELA